MKYNEFYEKLKKYRMITPIWEYELNLIEKEMNGVNNKDVYLILFSIYFSLIGKGNVCMSLDKDTLSKKWEKEIADAQILATDSDKNTEDEITKIKNDFKQIVETSIDAYNHLNDIITLNCVVNNNSKEHKIFEIENDYLYLRKYNQARKGVISSIKRLYKNYVAIDSDTFTKVTKELDSNNQETIYNLKGKFKGLSNKQKDVVISGINNNLVITGGPGTGKTTAILFILYYLLYNEKKVGKSFSNVYLAAASGKAASRMKESIINGLDNIKETSDSKPIIEKIKGDTKKNDEEDIEEFTIHRLLGNDFETGGFKYNKHNKFPNNSIFVIDEASMIDICLFNSLLEAIPDTARIFILGDKDQLPSVEVGAVFADLIEWDLLKNNKQVIKLDVSIRFTSNTSIYKLAQEVNEGKALNYKDRDSDKVEPLTIDHFNNADNFKLEKVLTKDKELMKKEFEKEEKDRIDTCPVYYYLNDIKDKDGNIIKQKENIEKIIEKWSNEFYKTVQKDCSNIKLKDNTKVNDEDYKLLSDIFNYTEDAKVLCCENEGIRGVKTINKLIKKAVIKKKIDNKEAISLSNQYPGQVMMINKNNKSLNLYNGDTGILVTFEDDETIYFMTKKTTNIVSSDGYIEDDIFKLGNFVFYPFRLITLSEIDLAYAITVHKSQGSDYNSILVILPTTPGHPLLNRQILYTAITRTKGNTYILSNPNSLNEAKDRLLERDTNIFK